MDEKLREQIINEINKSGFPLELHTSALLNKNNWFVKNNARYYDNYLEDFREIDIIATIKYTKIKDAFNELVIECKKSKSKPWVFFKQSKVVNDVLTLNVVAPGDGGYYKIYDKQMNKYIIL